MKMCALVRRMTALSAALTASFCFATPLADANAAYQSGDFERAISLAKPLASEGSADAQYLVGLMFWRGRGVNRDDGAAAEWFAKAVTQNHKDALNDLGTMYRDGEGVGKDEQRAFKLFALAAENGSVAGQFNIGKAYQHGHGIRKDHIRARYWYERADAAEARAEPPVVRVAGEPQIVKLKKIPDNCRPTRPPIAAMKQLGLREANGNMSFFIDAEGRIRGVTPQSISALDLRYEAAAYFSESLRSKQCELDTSVRGVAMVIPFRFVVTGW